MHYQESRLWPLWSRTQKNERCQQGFEGRPITSCKSHPGAFSFFPAAVPQRCNLPGSHAASAAGKHPDVHQTKGWIHPYGRQPSPLDCMRKAELTRAVQHRAKRQASIDAGCAAPWKVTHSSPDSHGCTARGGPHLLVPPESSVTLVANAGEPAADEVEPTARLKAGRS